MSKPSDLVQGTRDLLLLKIVALEPMHGWAIGKRLTQVSGEELSSREAYGTERASSSRVWFRWRWRRVIHAGCELE
jgi:hypothetical protein